MTSTYLDFKTYDLHGFQRTWLKDGQPLAPGALVTSMTQICGLVLAVAHGRVFVMWTMPLFR